MGILSEVLSSILGRTCKIDIGKLPSQGYFYPIDFEVRIKKAKIEDIIEYEYNFKPDNVLEIIEIIKNFVKKNIEFNKNYRFEDLKSLDIIFIFLEIVKFTNSKPIKISYFDVNQKKSIEINFTSTIFNYFDFSEFVDSHSLKDRFFEVDGYKFSMPSIGVENSVTKFLINKINDSNASFYNERSYDFLFFLGDKNELKDDEIENLITIFNDDIDEVEKIKIKGIISKFKNLIGYSVKVDDKIIDLKSNLDLENIWKE
jgi:hypothetical protein